MKSGKGQEAVYVPLIECFAAETEGLYKRLWINKKDDLCGLFIPHTFSGYTDAPFKTFFIGQDTYDWTALGNVYSMRARDYLKENNKWMSSIDNTLSWTNPYTFWHFVNRIQLTFNGCTPYNPASLSASQRVILNQIGWGNIYSLETLETITKYGDEFNATFDHKLYAELLKKSQAVSRLKNLIDAYRPDCIVILAWKDVEDWFLEGLDAKYIKEKSVQGLLSCYSLGYCDTQILWTYHPQALCRKGQDLGELARLMLEYKDAVAKK